MTFLLQTSSDMLSAYVSRCRLKSDFLSTTATPPVSHLGMTYVPSLLSPEEIPL